MSVIWAQYLGTFFCYVFIEGKKNKKKQGAKNDFPVFLSMCLQGETRLRLALLLVWCPCGA